MAIDTEAKRASAMATSTLDLLPVPSGTVDQAARQTVAWKYAGVLAGAVVAGVKSAYSRIALKIGIGI